MKLYSHTNFGELFSSVDVDFRFFAYIEIFEISKFVYYVRGSNRELNANETLFFLFSALTKAHHMPGEHGVDQSTIKSKVRCAWVKSAYFAFFV